MHTCALIPEAYFVESEPYLEATGNEITIFEAACKNKLPTLLKEPTGYGRKRFMEYMAMTICPTCTAQPIMWS